MIAAPPPTPGLRNWILVLVLGAVWGTAFMSVEIALPGFGPFTLAAARTALGAVALTVLARIMGQGLRTIPSARAWAFVAALGMTAAAVPFSLLSWGQQFVPSAFAGVAMGAVPLLTLLLVMYFAPQEGIGPRRIIGVALGFAGLTLLMGPGALDGSGDALYAGRIACVASAACYAAGNLITRGAPAMPPLAMAAGSLLTASVALIPVALVIEGWPDAFPPGPTAALLWIAAGPTALAALIQITVIRSAGSLFMSQVSYMVPIWSVIFGVTILNERLSVQIFAALALIVTGIGLGQWSARRRRGASA